MITLQKLPPSVIATLSERGLDNDVPLLTMRTDLGSDGVYKDIFIILYETKIAVAEGSLLFEGKAANRTEIFSCMDFKTYDIPKIEDLKTELYISSGHAVCKY
ncbi:MAG: hypothetical protein RRY76_04205, partial [Clostridia bacterium]